MTKTVWREDRYRELFGRAEKSELLASIWRAAYGDDYPEEVEPFGFVTKTDLHAFIEALRLKDRATLLDMGCGRGGPGLWVAREAGCELIGIDILPEAIAHAERLKARFNLARSARFLVGSFTETGLASGSVQAIVSVDAFWMVFDKTRALGEMARVIQPAGRLVMTTWIPPYMNIEAMLEAAAFELLSSCETDRWKARQLAVYDGILAHRDELPAAIGERAAAVMISEAEHARTNLATSPRCMVIAERRA